MQDDAEDYNFDYEDDDDDTANAGDVENKYYMAKSHRDNPPEAIKDFEDIIKQENDQGAPGEWCVAACLNVAATTCLPCVSSCRGFKALKQLTKLTFKLKRFDDSLGFYTRLLPYTKKAVTRKSAYALVLRCVR